MEFTAYILDVLFDSFYPARIRIEDGIFKEVAPILITEDTELDVDGLVVPGLIDAHIHIESSMLTPAQFAKIAVRHGFKGIEIMMKSASEVPFKFYFTASSCVPATSFETSGAVIDSEDIKFLLEMDDVVGLAEMMNFPGVINGDEEVLKKLEYARQSKKPIDGHAPLLTGKDLDKYLSQYILTDHECSTFGEAIEKKLKGMKIMVRDGSSAKNMEALFDISKRIEFIRNQDEFSLVPTEVLEKRINTPIFDFIVSDDKNPKDLISGHLNKSIKKATELGIDTFKSVEMVTINPAAHYNLNCGCIREGYDADFVIVDDLVNFNVLKTYIGGECVFDGENVLFDVPEFNSENSIFASRKTASDFDIHYDGDECTVNVINHDGIVQSDIFQDVLKISVVERYGHDNVSNAFIHGFGLKMGAVAASISHDSHNIITIGYDSEMMAKAVNMVIDNHGGIAVVSDEASDFLELPIAGLMSNEDGYVVAEKLAKLQQMVKALGCTFDAPFMTMEFMALLVIPSIKISDKGLFDGDNFEFMDVIVD